MSFYVTKKLSYKFSWHIYLSDSQKTKKKD